MRRTLSLLIPLTLLLAACGGGDDDAAHGGDSHGDDSEVAADARTVEVSATSFAFEPAELRAEAGEALAVELTSEDVEHDFVIDELDAHVSADAGETAEGGFTAGEAGTYTYYCSVAGHRDAGMEGELVVE